MVVSTINHPFGGAPMTMETPIFLLRDRSHVPILATAGAVVGQALLRTAQRLPGPLDALEVGATSGAGHLCTVPKEG